MRLRDGADDESEAPYALAPAGYVGPDGYQSVTLPTPREASSPWPLSDASTPYLHAWPELQLLPASVEVPRVLEDPPAVSGQPSDRVLSRRIAFSIGTDSSRSTTAEGAPRGMRCYTPWPPR